MKNTASILILIVFLIINIGCDNTKKTTNPTPVLPAPPKVIDITVGASEKLYAHKWELAMLNNKDVTSKAFLLFTPGQVNRMSGNTGCNNVGGSYTLTSYNTIKFSPLATTKMACMPDNSTTETDFLKALEQTDTWSANDTELSFYKGDLLLAKFNAAATSDNSTMLQGNWQLNYISGKRITFDGLYPDNKPQITFNFIKNEVSGNTSCNKFSSSFTVNANSINIADPKAITRMACAGEGESAFLEMIKKVNKYSVSGNTLNFLIGDIAVMRFEKK